MLFPELVSQNNLVGIAKLAKKSEVLATKRRVEYRDLETRKFIGRASGRKMPFDWTINPYRGCEFGCKYCYARFTHEFMELRDTEQFEREIYAKRFNMDSFRRSCWRFQPARASVLGLQPILISRLRGSSKLRAGFSRLSHVSVAELFALQPSPILSPATSICWN